MSYSLKKQQVMKAKSNIHWFMSFLLMFFFANGIAQDEDKASIGDVIYEEYQQKGVDQAISKYKNLKKNEPEAYNWDEFELNRIGYNIMLQDQDLDAAEKIFRLNMEEYPTAANPYDSYGDYLLERENPTEAKEYFRKSMSIAEKSDKEDERTRIYEASKIKLAGLEKKDKQLDFLIGDWKVASSVYDEGKEVNKYEGKDLISFDEDANALIIRHRNDEDGSEGIRMVAYDALDDEFDVAYINPNSLQGIQMSSMQMKPVRDNYYELIDRFEDRTGKEIVLKHELKKMSDNEMNWVIFEQDDNDQWQKIYAMHMKK